MILGWTWAKTTCVWN